MTAYIDGKYTPTGYNQWILEKGTTLWIDSRVDHAREQLSAREGQVQVECGNDGILYASGAFVIDVTNTNGIRYRFPRKAPVLSQNLDLPQNQSFVFIKGDASTLKEKHWVGYQTGQIMIRGMASAQAFYPGQQGNPDLLISVAGTTSETLVITDLRSFLKFDANPFPFWRAARADLDVEEREFRSILIDDNRVGAEAYKTYQKEMLTGLKKIREGYQLLQRNLYSQKVIEKMNQEGVAIPRLTLTDISILYGDLAHSIRPFVNWRGEGRVLVDRARLITQTSLSQADQAGGMALPPFDFFLEDLSNRMLTDTRLQIDNRTSTIEIRRPVDQTWNPRTDLQFDLDGKRHFISEGNDFRFSDMVDATGFFIRKEIAAKGEIRLSDLILSQNSVEYRFHPQADDPKAALQFAKFMDLRRILFHPDAGRRMSLLPAPFDDPRLSTFLSDGFDLLVAETFKQGIKEILGFHIRVSNPEPNQWTLEADVLDDQNRVAATSLQREIAGVKRIDEIWRQVQANRNIKYWLEMDWKE
jgi:hypothetical protein